MPGTVQRNSLKMDTKVSLWAVVAALVTFVAGYATLQTQVHHGIEMARTRDSRIRTIESAVAAQALSTARIEERLKSQDEKLSTIITRLPP